MDVFHYLFKIQYEQLSSRLCISVLCTALPRFYQSSSRPFCYFPSFSFPSIRPPSSLPLLHIIFSISLRSTLPFMLCISLTRSQTRTHAHTHTKRHKDNAFTLCSSICIVAYSREIRYSLLSLTVSIHVRPRAFRTSLGQSFSSTARSSIHSSIRREAWLLERLGASRNA